MSKIHSNNLANQNIAPFILPDLPFEKNALEPYMSSETFDFHYGKHHKAYVDTLNKLIENTKYSSKDLEEIIFGIASSTI